MRGRFFPILMVSVILSLADVASAQVATGDSLRRDAATAKIALSQESWNFGEVWHPEGAALTLIVRNEGNAELRISDVRATCGCTLVEAGRKLIPPGESTEVKVRFNSEGKQDHIESKVIIESNDPVRPTVEMPIEGVVRRAVKRTPLGGLVIRTLDGSPGQAGSVRLENQMPAPMRLKLVSTNFPALDVEVREVTDGLAYDVIARTKRELQPGEVLRGTLVFSTGLEKEAKLSLSARVEVLNRVQTVPPLIYLDPRTGGTTSERTVTVQYYGTGAFKVTAAESSHPDVTIKLSPTEPPSSGVEKFVPRITAIVRAKVSLPPASALPPDGALITFTTSDPDFPKVGLQVTTDPKVWDLKVRGPPEGPQRPAS